MTAIGKLGCNRHKSCPCSTRQESITAMKRRLNTKPLPSALLAAVIAWACAACHEVAHLPASAGFGPNPTLPTPDPSLIPTVNIAPAKGWPDGATPVAAPGTTVHALAQELDHPRWLYVLPNGDVLVAETDTPSKPDDNKGVKGWITTVSYTHLDVYKRQAQ